ncbi:Uncharacterised protein [Vibrio cholerae]|nr:Uncharacterised protein [Vibrio cholerae]
METRSVMGAETVALCTNPTLACAAILILSFTKFL